MELSQNSVKTPGRLAQNGYQEKNCKEESRQEKRRRQEKEALSFALHFPAIRENIKPLPKLKWFYVAKKLIILYNY